MEATYQGLVKGRQVAHEGHRKAPAQRRELQHGHSKDLHAQGFCPGAILWLEVAACGLQPGSAWFPPSGGILTGSGAPCRDHNMVNTGLQISDRRCPPFLPARNFPLSTAFSKIFPALIAGCPVIVKPSPHTPLTMCLAGELMAGLVPPGVVQVLPGGDRAGRAIVSHPCKTHGWDRDGKGLAASRATQKGCTKEGGRGSGRGEGQRDDGEGGRTGLTSMTDSQLSLPGLSRSAVAKITFTGSVSSGKAIQAACAEHMKRTTLELGGNDV